MNADSVPFTPTRDQLIGFISDTYKEINGFRPRPVWSELTYAKLDQWGRDLSAEVITYRKQSAIRERIERKLRSVRQKVWVEKKRTYFTPANWSIGDLISI
jgi:hypothetical protein